MTPNKAKRLTRNWLSENMSLHSLTLSARTIGFSDLGRGSRVFVKVSGWSPDPRADNLIAFAREAGFSVEFA